MTIKNIVKRLIKYNKTISTMESCTGGFIVSSITNIEGASSILKYSAVTYSNEFKIKMGVDSKVIDKYSVYSMETAREMSKKISCYTNSNYGVGVTGKLCRVDNNNLFGEDNLVFISIYDKDNNKYYCDKLYVTGRNRKESKKQVLDKFMELFKTIGD